MAEDRSLCEFRPSLGEGDASAEVPMAPSPEKSSLLQFRPPQYHRTRNAHILETVDTHLYVFPWSKRGFRRDSGLTVKRRGADGFWRHYTLRFTFQGLGGRWDGSRMAMLEAVTHRSEASSGGRIVGSKRYLRLKAAV